MRISRIGIKRAYAAFATACLAATGVFALPAIATPETAAVAQAQQAKPTATFKKGAEVWTKYIAKGGKTQWVKTKLAGFDRDRMAGYIPKNKNITAGDEVWITATNGYVYPVGKITHPMNVHPDVEERNYEAFFVDVELNKKINGTYARDLVIPTYATKVNQGDRIEIVNTTTHKSALCTLGYVDKENQIGITANHCVPDYPKGKAIVYVHKDNDKHKRYLGEVVQTNYNYGQNKFYNAQNDVAAFTFDNFNQDYAPGNNTFSGNKMLNASNVKRGDTICYYGKSRNKVQCGNVAKVSDFGTVTAAGILAIPGDSGGPVWIKNKGFVGPVSGGYTRVFGPGNLITQMPTHTPTGSQFSYTSTSSLMGAVTNGTGSLIQGSTRGNIAFDNKNAQRAILDAATNRLGSSSSRR